MLISRKEIDALNYKLDVLQLNIEYMKRQVDALVTILNEAYSRQVDRSLPSKEDE